MSVNNDAINTAVGFAEVRLNEPDGAADSLTTFRIGVTNPLISDAPGAYILKVTRKGDTRPMFASEQVNIPTAEERRDDYSHHAAQG